MAPQEGEQAGCPDCGDDIIHDGGTIDEVVYVAKSKSDDSGSGDSFTGAQLALDIAGSSEVPIISQAADFGSGCISCYNGDYFGAGLSFGGIFIPGLSQTKLARNLTKNSLKYVDEAYDVASSKFWKKEKYFKNIKVYQRDDLFDMKKISMWKENKIKIKGTNLDRMKSGRTPIGHDNKPVNLHHLIQNERAGLAEVTQTFHKKYHKILHINSNKIPSGINRSKFNTWKKKYWKNRADEL